MSNCLRFVTAASLFDGHDASINIIRRILQAQGVEVIHLGHNRSALEVVDAAISEDADAVALSSYQGGHNEYFRYIRALLDEKGAKDIKIFAGGGGVITPKEISSLEADGIEKIYSPQDGMQLGLEGIIGDMIKRCKDKPVARDQASSFNPKKFSRLELAKLISHIENSGDLPVTFTGKKIPVFGITGTGGAGKSSLIDELLLRFNQYYPDKKIALVSVDPTRKRTQGALLGDRIRLGSAVHENLYIRSLATRGSGTELSPQISKVVGVLRSLDFDLVLVETSGIGQAADNITKVADQCLYVMTPEYGAQTQLEKIEMLEAADFVAVNKFEKPRALDALRDVRKQYKRNKTDFQAKDESLPIYGTMAGQFNNTGVNALFRDLALNFGLDEKPLDGLKCEKVPSERNPLIPASRQLYLRQISDSVRGYNEDAQKVVGDIKNWGALARAFKISGLKELEPLVESHKEKIDDSVFKEIKELDDTLEQYRSGEFSYKVRDKEFKVESKYESLSHLKISRVGIPNIQSAAEKFRFIRNQNIPGRFPFAAGIFPFKRKDEEPKRMFAGEGGPARTNERFHYLSKNDTAKRLSTAFDSVTLYGEDPDERPDIFGKVGESGVSICTLDDMKRLFQGFELADPNTSVSKTINGPAPIILAMYMNAAIAQNLEGDDFWDEKKRIAVMQQVRGTVQADILKEDQAQNTCIFSLDFALKMMGDVQEYFCKNKIKNYYTVSISGYHIAEAGANPISQLAFTLSNGFTYVEYYLSRGLDINEFAPNLSFFFSNGLDPEYTVIGRVARKIWAIAMRDVYGANEKSQKLKYHIQTSGRSLHAQEIDFNDIRTTLQAFLALSDNCNSLHTNAYDEAITTPTAESVRRAMAIQMIINREFGLNKTDNPLQGSYIFDELADLVEEAVLVEFERISDRGGVMGSMESMYQRGKIQEESLYYETLKDNGKLPIIGVNTYIAENINDQFEKEIEMTRASDDEKNAQITKLRAFQNERSDKSTQALETLERVAVKNGNIFEELLNTVNYCSLGQITNVLYKVGGRYRRNM
jgi:methylmalonyl-CoA mutase